MTCFLAYLSSPQSGRYFLNIKQDEAGAEQRFEISKGQLSGLLIEGVSMALRSSPNNVMRDWLVSRDSRVPEATKETAERA